MDVLIKHRHGTETRATDVVSHGNTGDQWYRLDHTDGSTSLVPMDSIMIVEFREDQPPGEMSFDPETVQKMRDALKPKKRPEALALDLEADIRELHGAEPAELAATLVRKGWVKS